MKMRHLTLALLLGTVPLATYAGTDDVDALVESVRQEALKEAAHDEQRIEEFLAARAEQQNMLRDARRQLDQQNRRADQLRAEYEENELTLTRYEASLRERAGDPHHIHARNVA